MQIRFRSLRNIMPSCRKRFTKQFRDFIALGNLPAFSAPVDRSWQARPAKFMLFGMAFHISLSQFDQGETVGRKPLSKLNKFIYNAHVTIIAASPVRGVLSHTLNPKHIAPMSHPATNPISAHLVTVLSLITHFTPGFLFALLWESSASSCFRSRIEH